MRVWPASSLWLTLGDAGHKVKYAESISTTPVVFGIRKSLAQELGFTQGGGVPEGYFKGDPGGRSSPSA